jgi:hypothetical protein
MLTAIANGCSDGDDEEQKLEGARPGERGSSNRENGTNKYWQWKLP